MGLFLTPSRAGSDGRSPRIRPVKSKSPLYAPSDDTPRPLVASRTKGISNERIKDDDAGARLGFERVLLAATNPRPDGAARPEHPLITKAEGII